MLSRKLITGPVVAVTAALAFGAPAAQAAHCTEGSATGFSYFGSQAAEGNDRGSFDGGASQGASVCRERTGSPSERAPGQNR